MIHSITPSRIHVNKKIINLSDNYVARCNDHIVNVHDNFKHGRKTIDRDITVIVSPININTALTVDL